MKLQLLSAAFFISLRYLNGRITCGWLGSAGFRMRKGMPFLMYCPTTLEFRFLDARSEYVLELLSYFDVPLVQKSLGISHISFWTVVIFELYEGQLFQVVPASTLKVLYRPVKADRKNSTKV